MDGSKNPSSPSKDKELDRSLQVNTHVSPIRTAPACTQEVSSTAHSIEEASPGGPKLYNTMMDMMHSLQQNMLDIQSRMTNLEKGSISSKEEMSSILSSQKELEKTMKRNTYEVYIINNMYTKFEKNLFNRQSKMFAESKSLTLELHQTIMSAINLTQAQMVEVSNAMNRAEAGRMEQVDSFVRSIQVAEEVEAAADKERALINIDFNNVKKGEDYTSYYVSKEKEAPRSSQLTEEEEEAERLRRAEAKFPGLTKKAAAQATKDDARLERERRRLEGFVKDNKKKKEASSVSVPTKRKREPSKKVQIADLLNEVTETVITSIPQQAAQVEEEVEEQLQPRSTRQR
ncbi:myosin heavy chain, clone 203-like, partial [Impatiens glandulifera]|uniref:myosin heavy chain, clone 203-like n=1 Tax=Impatiens glandulifera TaxID=253017 RepID=UPI001FB193CD